MNAPRAQRSSNIRVFLTGYASAHAATMRSVASFETLAHLTLGGSIARSRQMIETSIAALGAEILERSLIDGLPLSGAPSSAVMSPHCSAFSSLASGAGRVAATTAIRAMG